MKSKIFILALLGVFILLVNNYIKPLTYVLITSYILWRIWHFVATVNGLLIVPMDIFFGCCLLIMFLRNLGKE